MEGSQTVNALNQKLRARGQQRKGSHANQNERRFPAKRTKPDNKDNKQQFYNCSRVEHFARHLGCPAKTKSCNKCGVKGHFSECCKKEKPGDQDKKKEKTYIKFRRTKTNHLKINMPLFMVNMDKRT